MPGALGNSTVSNIGNTPEVVKPKVVKKPEVKKETKKVTKTETKNKKVVKDEK